MKYFDSTKKLEILTEFSEIKRFFNEKFEDIFEKKKEKRVFFLCFWWVKSQTKNKVYRTRSNMNISWIAYDIKWNEEKKTRKKEKKFM